MSFMARNCYLPTSVFSSVMLGHRAILPSAMRGRLFYPMQGFTLLELLLVLTLLALLAGAAVAILGGTDDQGKYDETKRRMALIRQAMVGEPARSVNGTPDVGGFVADIGRPPANLQELLEQGSLPGHARDAASGLWVGWRGPYLYAAPESGGSRALRDGYLNPGGAPNYGWSYGVDPGGTVALSSAGATTDAGDDIADPALVVADDWNLPLSAVSVRIHNQSGTDSTAQTVRLRLYYPVDGAVPAPGPDTDSDAFGVPALSAVQAATVVASFATELALPIGVRGYVVVCEDATPANRRLYDGDCDGGNPLPGADAVQPLLVAPRMALPTLEWVLR